MLSTAAAWQSLHSHLLRGNKYPGLVMMSPYLKETAGAVWQHCLLFGDPGAEACITSGYGVGKDVCPP